MPSKFLSLLPFFLPFASAAPTGSCNDDASTRPTATIDSGPVAGTSTTLPSSNSTVNKFLGIPFAAPPVRFSPPERPEPWIKEYDASSYRSACIQKFDDPQGQGKLVKEWLGGGELPEGEKEDCLYINVFTPSTKVAGEEGKAVLLWIYGGSFMFGASSLRIYDGSWLAGGQDVVVVTFNYRTNVFGFPGAPELPETERNLGVLDQRLAIDWVQRNIASFGGDPKKVTLFGESAGAWAADMLITAPPDPLPFRAAIMQSGQSTVPIPMVIGGGSNKSSWTELAKLANCSTERALECIRALPAAQIRDIVSNNSLGFPAVKDGVTYSKTGRQDRLNSTNEKSLIARVPYMIGNNANEGSLYVIGQNDTAKFLRNAVPDIKDEFLQTVLKAYPVGSPLISNEAERIDQIITELLTTCPSAIHAAESGSVGISAWQYYFNASFPNSDLFPKSGAYHSAEIEMVFGSYKRENVTAWQKETSDVMMKIWADFAKNPEKGPGWDVAEKGEVAVFGGGVSTGDKHWTNKAFERVLGENLNQRCALFKDILGA